MPRRGPSVENSLLSHSGRTTLLMIGCGRDAAMICIAGPWVQVSRLGNPLINEVLIPLGQKDYWNAVPPAADSAFLRYVNDPELARLLPVLYPKVFPNLAAYKSPARIWPPSCGLP